MPGLAGDVAVHSFAESVDTFVKLCGGLSLAGCHGSKRTRELASKRWISFNLFETIDTISE